MTKKILKGTVKSAKNKKTIVVEVTRKFKHPFYEKIIKRSKKYHAHDEKNKFKEGVVRTRKEIYRDDGSKVQFDTNAVVLTDDKGEPIGTRIFGPVTRELRSRGHTKIISLAPEVL